MTRAAASARRKTPYYFKTATDKYAKLQLKDSVLTAAVKTAIGADATITDSQDIVANNKEEAALRGIFYLRVVYQATPERTQTIDLPIAPDKADTARDQLIGKTYAGKKIVSVRVPRRVKYVI